MYYIFELCVVGSDVTCHHIWLDNHNFLYLKIPKIRVLGGEKTRIFVNTVERKRKTKITILYCASVFSVFMIFFLMLFKL